MQLSGLRRVVAKQEGDKKWSTIVSEWKFNDELDVKHESQYASVIADRAKLECFTRLLTSFVLVKSMRNAHKQHNYYGHNDATTFQNLT